MSIELLNPISRHLVILTLLLVSPLASAQDAQEVNQVSTSSQASQANKHNSPEAAHSVEERVKKILIEKAGVKEPALKNTNVSFANLGLDSLDQAQLFLDLEREFNTRVSDEQAETIKTVQQAIDFIKRYKK